VVVPDDTLAAHLHGGIGDEGLLAAEFQEKLVEFGIFGIDNRGKVGAAVDGAVIAVVAYGVDVFHIETETETVEIAGLVTKAGAQVDGVGVTGPAVLVNEFIAETGVED